MAIDHERKQKHQMPAAIVPGKRVKLINDDGLEK
jgi:hypothetical protein